MIRTFIATMLASFAATALPANIDPRLAKDDACGPYWIFHINGIQTTEADANKNRAELAAAYGNAHKEHLTAIASPTTRRKGRCWIWSTSSRRSSTNTRARPS